MSTYKKHGTPYIRPIIDPLIGKTWKALVSGALAGAVTNSGKSVTFSLAGVVGSGLVNARQTLPVILGASFGSSLLVLWVLIDFKVIELLLLGVAGLYYQFGNMKKGSTKFIAGLVLGLGLVFYGLDLFKGGAGALKDSEAVLAFLSSANSYWIVAFLLGAVGAFLTQSGSSISIVAIAFASTGLLDIHQTVMFIYGTNIGSGLSTAMLALALKGTSRQLVMFHAAVKMVGAIVLVPLLYVEVYGGIPLVEYAAAYVSNGAGTQIGAIYVSYEVVSALLLLGLLTPMSKMLARFWPPKLDETLSHLKFAHRVTVSDIPRGIRLIEMEQARVLQRVVRYFDVTRNVAKSERIDVVTLHEANRSVLKEIERHIGVLMSARLSPSQSERVLRVHSLQQWLSSLDYELNELSRHIAYGAFHNVPKLLHDGMLVSLSVLFRFGAHCLRRNDIAAAYLLVELTEKRESFIGQVRPKNVALSKTVEHYERAVWTMNKIGHTLARDLETSDATPPSHVHSPPPTWPVFEARSGRDLATATNR